MKKNFKLIMFISIQLVIVLTIILLVLFAGKKTYTVTFDLNGGTYISGSLVQTIRYGQSATPPEVTKDGAFLLEWSESYKKVTKDIETSAVWEYETSYGIEFEYDENSNYCLISGSYEGISGDIYIGSFYNDMRVLGIKEGAFAGRENITGIYLLDGIISIGKDAFSGCKNLKNVVIPSTVETIGTNILKGCNKVENLSIPFIGNSIYDNTDSTLSYLFGLSSNFFVPETLKELTITSDYQIPKHGLRDCRSIEKVTILGDVETIEEYAFTNCTNLKEVVLPDSLLEIKEKAFINTGLEKLTIPDEVKELKDGSFANCPNLTTVTFGINLQKINSSAFQNCPSLNKFEIPKQNDYIEYDDGKLYLIEGKDEVEVEILEEEYQNEYCSFIVSYYNFTGELVGKELVLKDHLPTGSVLGYTLNGELYLDQQAKLLFVFPITIDITLYGNFQRN